MYEDMKSQISDLIYDINEDAPDLPEDANVNSHARDYTIYTLMVTDII